MRRPTRSSADWAVVEDSAGVVEAANVAPVVATAMLTPLKTMWLLHSDWNSWKAVDGWVLTIAPDMTVH